MRDLLAWFACRLAVYTAFLIGVGVAVFVLLWACVQLGFLYRADAREQYAGQFDDVDPATREWFKSVKARSGVPCCDVADGHLVDFTVDAQGHYHVPIDGEMILVPPEAVVLNAGNPYEKAVVWYVRQAPDSIFVRCFVPAGGV